VASGGGVGGHNVRWRATAKGAWCWRCGIGYGEAGPNLAQQGHGGAITDGLLPCCTATQTRSGQAHLDPVARQHGRAIPPLSGRVEVMLLVAFGGEFLDSEKLIGLTGGMVASRIVRPRPRASWCSLGRGCLARSEVAATPFMAYG
jgi:hypothetical protein